MSRAAYPANLLFAILLAACGGESDSDSTPKLSGGSGGQAGSVAVGGMTATDGATQTGGTGGTAAAGGSGQVGGAGGHADSGTIEYRGCELATGAVRFAVTKTNAAGGACTILVFVYQGGAPDPLVQLPDQWTLESAVTTSDVTNCKPGGAASKVSASTASGTASWTPSGKPSAVPKTIDLDLELGFPPSATWLSGKDVLKATGVVINKC